MQTTLMRGRPPLKKTTVLGHRDSARKNALRELALMIMASSWSREERIRAADLLERAAFPGKTEADAAMLVAVDGGVS